MAIVRFGRGLHRFLNRPDRVLLMCTVFLSMSLLFNGVLWRLWGLHRDLDRLGRDTIEARENLVTLDRQLAQAKDPAFIEQQARDRLDLAGENDLVFVFPEE